MKDVSTIGNDGTSAVKVWSRGSTQSTAPVDPGEEETCMLLIGLG